MIGALIRVRFQSLFAALTQQGKKRDGKKISKGKVALFAFLYCYVGVVLCSMMAFLFHTLVLPYHIAGLDWLYFAMAGLVSLVAAVFGTAFSTQNELYAAKDNDLLLSMPIKPGDILLSRMLFLLIMNFAMVGLILATAAVIYLMEIGTMGIGLLMLILSAGAMTLLSLAIACLLGWVMHLLTGKMNKSLSYALFTIIFFAVYFGLYSQADTILTAMANNGAAIALSLQSWVWIIYAMGQGCAGNLGLGVIFLLICGAVFALVYRLLSKTFLSAATTSYSVKRKKLNITDAKTSSVTMALVAKEMKLFVGTPIYLMNMGLGLVFTVILAVAGIVFRSKILEALGDDFSAFAPLFPMVICAALMYLNAMSCVSTPAVSLEGKSIWILKSLPVSSKQILQSKLLFHVLMTVPVTAIAGLVLGVSFGCGAAGTMLCILVPSLTCLLSGLMGLFFGSLWARLDWINEAYPCKQSISVMVVLFTMMLLPVAFAGLYFGLLLFLSPVVFLSLCAVMLALMCMLFYWLVITKSTRRWNSL